MKNNDYVTIHIDTSDNMQIRAGVGKKNEAVRWFIEQISKAPAQRILPIIQKGLASEGKTWKDIGDVAVNPGPGSFTGLRVGFAVANALVYLLGLKKNYHDPIYEDSTKNRLS